MWSTTAAEKRDITSIISALDTPRVLEIGGFRGETTRIMAETASRRGGSVIVIDPMRWAAEVVANGLARHLPRRFSPVLSTLSSWLGKAGYEESFWENVGPLRSHVRLYRELSTAPWLLESDEPELQRFEVVFIDGDHSQAGAESDLWNWGRRTVLGGTILVHDATPEFPGVLAALRTFAAASGLTVELPIRDSLAAIHVTRSLTAMTGRRVGEAQASWPAPAPRVADLKGTSMLHRHPATAHGPSRSMGRAGGAA